MEEAMKQFKTYEETPDADPASVFEQYLDPLHLMLEMPDMSRLDPKPAKPPVPQVMFFDITKLLKYLLIVFQRSKPFFSKNTPGLSRHT